MEYYTADQAKTHLSYVMNNDVINFVYDSFSICFIIGVTSLYSMVQCLSIYTCGGGIHM